MVNIFNLVSLLYLLLSRSKKNAKFVTASKGQNGKQYKMDDTNEY
jgi:hypothetical protein